MSTMTTARTDRTNTRPANTTNTARVVRANTTEVSANSSSEHTWTVREQFADNDHATAMGKGRKAQAAYACQVLAPPAEPRHIIAFLNAYGAGIGDTGRANMNTHITAYRKANNQDTSGNLMSPLTAEDIDRMDAERAAPKLARKPAANTRRKQPQQTASEQPQGLANTGNEQSANTSFTEVTDREHPATMPHPRPKAPPADPAPAAMAEPVREHPTPATNTPAGVFANNPNEHPAANTGHEHPPVFANTNNEQPAATEAANSSREQSANTSDKTEAEREKAAGKVVAGAPRIMGALYLCVASIALYGQSDGMLRWLRIGQWDLPAAVQRAAAMGPGAVVELFAIALMAFADNRTVVHVERAFAARMLAYAFALGVVALNWISHAGDPASQAFFAGVSAAGFCVYLIHSAARRRDAFRALGKTTTPAPMYPAYQWLFHPVTTWAARCAAVATTDGMGTQESLNHVAAQRAAEAAEAHAAAKRRHLDGLIRRLFAEKYAKAGDELGKLKTEIEATAYDLDDVARTLSEHANTKVLAGLIAGELMTVGNPDANTPEVPANTTSEHPDVNTNTTDEAGTNTHNEHRDEAANTARELFANTPFAKVNGSEHPESGVAETANTPPIKPMISAPGANASEQSAQGANTPSEANTNT